MTRNLLAAVAIIVAAAAVASSAQQGFIPPPSGVRRAEPWRPAESTGRTRIVGTVIDIRQVPVAYARVQLRDLVNGTVVQEAASDGNGEYAFVVDDPSTFVVEMALLDGYVVALSNAGSVARHETLQTVVQLPGRWDALASRVVYPQNAGAFIGLSGANTMTNTTMEMALDQNIPPADSGEPVSPRQ